MNELCMRKLYDQDDGDVTYCQLPKGHSRKQKHTPWPDLHVYGVEHVPISPPPPVTVGPPEPPRPPKNRSVR